MQFGNPILLWSLAALPLLAWLGWRARRRCVRAMERLGQSALIARLRPESVAAWRTNRALAGLAAFTLLALAAARPQYGRVEQVLRRAGVDVIIAIDVSPSMLAQDVKPNRLVRAKESLRRLVRRLAGNRVGIVAFAGEAFLNCPMTLDLSLATLVLEALDEKSIAVPGTDLGAAIKTAQGAFERGGAGIPALVLITDGEDNEGAGLKAAEEAAKAGVQIYAIAIGTESGGPIPDAQSGYKEARDGTKVNSKMDLTGLVAIARAAGGAAYAAGANPDPAIDAIARRVEKLQTADQETKRTVIHQDRFVWFLPPAMILVLWMLVSRPAREPEQGKAAAPAARREAARAQ